MGSCDMVSLYLGLFFFFFLLQQGYLSERFEGFLFFVMGIS